MIKHFFDLKLPKNKPWLIIGKGPTFSKIWELDLFDYYTVGMNRVTDVLNVTIAHCIDIDTNLCDTFVSNCQYVVIPHHPHINCKVVKRNLDDLSNSSSVLEKAIEQNKLYTYSLSTWKQSHKFSPVVGVKFFSAEAVFNLLALQGIKKIFSVGIDGGTTYAKEFEHCRPLKNGRKSFDVQFAQIYKTVDKYGIQYERI